MANPQNPLTFDQPQEDDDSVFFDLLAAPFRGVEGAVQGVYNLADYATFDALPDYDERFLGKSTTVPGSLVEGASQFLTGFIPIFGLAGRVGTAAKAGSLTQKALSGTVSRGVVAGAITDFTMFNGQEERLSNFIQQFPELQNPVTEFLSHDEDEGEIEGRLKNVLEGLGLEAATFGLIKGLKALKRGKSARANGDAPEDVYKGMSEELGEDQVALLPDFAGQATFEGVMQNKILFMWDEGYSTEEIARTLKIDEAKVQNDLVSDAGEDPRDFIRGRRDSAFQPKVSQEAIEGVGMNVAIRMWDEGYSTKEISKTVNLPQGFIEDEFISLGEDPRDFIKGRKDTGFPLGEPKAAAEKAERIVFSTAIEMWTDGYSLREISNALNFPEERLVDEFISLGEDPRDFLGRKDRPFAELPDFLEGAKPNVKDPEAFEASIEARPPRQPHKTNLEAKRGLEGSRGPDYIKKRLQAKFTIKGADPEDVKDIETFIDTIGERMFDDVSMSVTNKIQARGRFNFSNKLLEIRKSAIEEGDLKRPMIHELWHSLSRYLPKKDVTALTKQFEKARADYLKSLGDGPITADPSTVTTPIRSKELINFKKGVYNDANYRFSDIDEYFAEEMTDAFLSKLDADEALAAPGTFKRVAQEMAILLKDLFASLKSKLGIDQRQKIFNDFIKQRNVKIQRQAPLDFSSGKVAEMKDFGKEVSPEHAGIARAIARGESVTLPRFETSDQLHSLTAALRAEVMKDRKTLSKLDAEAEKGLPVDFGDNDMTDRFKHMEQTTKNQKQVRLEATIYKKIGTNMVNKLHKIAQEYKASGGGDVATANLKNAFQEMVQFSEMYWKLGRETSLALGVRRQGGGSRRKIGLDSNEMTGEGIRKNFVNENGGMSPEKIIKAVEEGVDPNDLESSINGMFKLARKTQGHKLLDVATEYWINSILSGPRTQMVNIMGNGLTTVWSTLETAVGGVLSGNLEVTKQAFASWADMSMFREAMKFAKNAAKSGENLLDPDARAFNEGQRNAIVPEAFGMKEGQRGYGTVEGIGNFLRLPSRLLMTTDEFFKQLNYRRAARFKLAMDGVTKQGIKDPQQLAQYVEKGLEDVITSGGRHYSEESLIREGGLMADKNGIKDASEKSEFVSKYVQDNSKGKDASALADFALEESRYLTFTKDLDQRSLGATIQKATQSWSPLRFVMPFVRTPTNILAFAFERTPGVFVPGFLKEERKQLLEGWKSSDPVERSKTLGKMATSITLTAVLIDTVINNREYITGGGPKDEKQKKALRATGWQPYSIKVGDKYYSYQRLDPLGTVLGVGADLVDTYFKAPKDVNTSTYENIFSALSITFARNVTNKSYLAGVQMFTEALSDPDRYSERLLRNLGSSMLPYSGFLNQIQYGTGDQEAREVRSLADALLNKLPGGRDNLDPKRNLLGEEVIIENTPIIGAINPIATSTQKNDAVLNEMANLNHAFREPPSTYNGLIDLLGYTNANGQTAHDRRNEKLQTVKIGGRTLRQSLERLIKSRNYQRLSDRSEPGLPSPRIRQITSLLTKYRSEALDETMQEFPELGDYYEQVTRAKRSFKAGADHSSVLSLLNQ